MSDVEETRSQLENEKNRLKKEFIEAEKKYLAFCRKYPLELPKQLTPHEIRTKMNALGAAQTILDTEFDDEALKPIESEEKLGEERKELILMALAELDHDNDDHWTSAGLPEIKAAKTIMNDSVTRAEIEAVDPDLKRQTTE